MLIFISCDYVNYTDIDIRNKSTYDLFIEFKLNPNNHDHSGYDSISLKKNESTSLLIHCYIGGNSAPDPNDDVISIIFADLNSRKIIKELKNKKYFQSTGGDVEHGQYLLIINDDILYTE
jgi:hypothetical protein